MFYKKILIFILSALMLLGSVGCGNGDNSTESPSSKGESEESSEAPQSSYDSSDDDFYEDDFSEEDFMNEFLKEIEVSLETYTNPLMDSSTENVWENTGIADPFVMRYNGKYYLYATTEFWYTNMKVWVSDDLVNWEFAGDCAVDDRLMVSYAPEVTYYNGDFYMYTSPGGNGHYILKSSSPLGPFTIVTDNLGNSIDGHVFIDDDGKWYFYHAGEGNLCAKEMSSPTDLSAVGKTIGAAVNSEWTEGAMVIKRNGIYYLTYCGNHCWSKGYRIEGAVSTSNPMSFVDIPGNILMLNTDEPAYGIGHSSTVLGPDMDTYYIVYHSLLPDYSRRLHVDALCFNGMDFSVLGITTTPQQVPKKPEISTDNTSLSEKFTYKDASIEQALLKIKEGGQMLTKDIITSKKYTAEINFLSIEDKAGMIFSYVDEGNYAYAVLDTKAQNLVIYVYQNGEKSFERSFSLPKSFSTDVDFTKLQSLSMKNDGKRYTFMLNGLTVANVQLELPEGRVGILSSSAGATVGYVAVSFAANGSSLKTYYKPIEGEITAITSVENGKTEKKDGISYVVMKEGDIRNYYVNVNSDGTYDVHITYYAETDTVLQLYSSGSLLAEITLSATGGENSSAVIRGVSLKGGAGIISFKAASGKASVLSYTFTKGEAVTEQVVDFNNYTYMDGTWTVDSNKLVVAPIQDSDTPHGKIFFGSESYGDYAASADFTLNGDNRSVGLVVRGSNPSLGGAGDDSFLGKYFYCGYYVAFNRTRSVCVYKVNYNLIRPVVTFNETIDVNVKHNLRVEVIGNKLQIFLDGSLLGEYVDNELPFFNGSVGVSSINSTATIENLKIEPK